MSLTSRIGVELTALLTGTADFGPPSSDVRKARSFPLANGTGANQADRLFADRRTLAASASESLDLAGSLVDTLGATITFARVRALLVEASSGNTNNVVVGGAASNAFASMFGDATDKLVVRPGGAILLLAPGATGYAVTATTGDLLQVANSGGTTSVTYDITIIGASA
ncbi:hypothetical protein [Actinomadura litoris]|uniref:hypothetical protein n=1 Tax=Actinomadura litoris TaxID=2678616 RepID=UPI001FA6D29F|nr:hypothetical protein [Actinomadura litoris]